MATAKKPASKKTASKKVVTKKARALKIADPASIGKASIKNLKGRKKSLVLNEIIRGNLIELLNSLTVKMPSLAVVKVATAKLFSQYPDMKNAQAVVTRQLQALSKTDLINTEKSGRISFHWGKKSVLTSLPTNSGHGDHNGVYGPRSNIAPNPGWGWGTSGGSNSLLDAAEEPTVKLTYIKSSNSLRVTLQNTNLEILECPTTLRLNGVVIRVDAQDR